VVGMQRITIVRSQMARMKIKKLDAATKRLKVRMTRRTNVFEIRPSRKEME